MVSNGFIVAIVFNDVDQRCRQKGNGKAKKKPTFASATMAMMTILCFRLTTLYIVYIIHAINILLSLTTNAELWDFFLDHFGLFDSSTVCFTSHREHSLQTINQLMNFHYLNSKYQGIGCSMFLYCLSNDFLVNIFSSLRLPDGGGVVFAFKVPNHGFITIYIAALLINT